MPKPEVRVLEVSEYEAWDGFVATSPQGTLFHKSYWLTAGGMKFRIYGAFKGSELVGGLTICFSISRLGLTSGFSPPLTPYLGVIFKASRAKYVTRLSDEKEISQRIATRLRVDFDSIAFRFTPFSTDIQPFIWAGFSSGFRYTYLLELDDLENVWKEMDAKRRNDITRAQKDKIHVESGCNFEEMFTLVEKTFNRQERDTAFKLSAFKYNSMLNKKGQCKSFLARNKDGKAIAAAYIVWDEKRSYYLLGGYDSDAKHHGASAMAIWEAIRFTKEELGLNEFDFEGSMLQPVELFFRKFGGTLTPYYFVDWIKPSIKLWLTTRNIIESGLRTFRLGE